MFVFDQLKREDPALRLVAFMVFWGLVILLAGLWWTQIVNYREYQSKLENQTFRSVRLPAPRGMIVDRNGLELAYNQPRYNVSLYLEELRGAFQDEYKSRVGSSNRMLQAQRQMREKQLDRRLTKQELKPYSLSLSQRNAIGEEGRFFVASNLAARVGAALGAPIELVRTNFDDHFSKQLALPFPILENLNARQIARFEERFSGIPGLDLDADSIRVYPFNQSASHVVGYLRRDLDSREGERAYFKYRLRDYRGLIGIEGGFDSELRGMAGGKSVLVNNLGYRQEETVWQPTVPGNNVVLTLDMRLQLAAEKALQQSATGGANTRGAVVVMDVRTGDVLALVSSPAYNPNYFVQGFPPGQWARQHDEVLKPEYNRATQDIYQPGSIFKIVVGMAALELGLDPDEIYTVPSHPDLPGRGIVRFGRNQSKMDLAPPGTYTFPKAFAKSSNGYFIFNGLKPGVVEKVVELGRQLHLGEPTGIPTRQESSGHFPKPEDLRSGWSVGTTANLCIGQERIDVTPIQMAVMISAVANGGTVFWPRLVQRLESQDPLITTPVRSIERGRVRDRLSVSRRTLSIINNAMLADTLEGTGTKAAVPGFNIGGKTGTAEIQNLRGENVDKTTWFASYGPWESPRYAVVVMVESGQSGGTTCGPIAKAIYEAIVKLEQGSPVEVGLNRN